MDTTFAQLGLNEHILAGVEALGFSTPTPVQAQAIPLILEGRDVVASAQTGTGKTCAFALPVLQRIAEASRAARERIAAEAMEAAAAADDEGPETLADEVTPEASLSVPAPGDEGSGTPRRRRRRRHHRRRSAAPDASPEAASTQDGGAEGSDADKGTTDGTGQNGSDAPDAAPRRRRRRRRRKNPQTANAQQADAQQAEARQEDAPTSESGPKPAPSGGKRRRRRKRPAAAKSQTPPKPKAFGPFALVITPTRELAQQIEQVVTVVCEHTNQRAVIVMGGARFERQIRSLEAGCDMLVATPGRLIDLMEHDHVDLKDVQVLVLDEADRMLDMGFWPSVRRIMAELPDERQNLLFSATIPPSIKSTIDAMLRDPAYVEISRVGQTAETVEEHLCPITQGQKTQLLQELVRSGGAEPTAPERVLVFCRTKQRVDDVSRTLKNAGFKVDVMHADRPQKAREKALEKFRAGTCQVLVATDVMSRGIDVSGIDAVVNYDVPLDPEDYVHRIGRTGRAGATGHAYTFVAPDEISPLREIEYFTGKLVPTWDLPGFVYDDGRIVPGASRGTVKPKRTMFSGSRARGRGRGIYGRHY